MYRSVVLSSLLLVLACASEDDGVGQSRGEGEPSDGPRAMMGPEPALAEGGDPVCEPGDRRDSVEGDTGPRCVCLEQGFWGCFGVSPERQIGGSTTCSGSLNSLGEDCYWILSDCRDNRTYSVTCSQGNCFCVVNATVVGQLEPGLKCPGSLEEVNMLCSWALAQ